MIRMNPPPASGIESDEGEKEGRSRVDRAIVDRARAGDPDAFAAIVRDRLDEVYRVSLAILGNEPDARDATQEAFVAAWRQLPRLRDPDRFDAWLGRIAVNAARQVARSGRRRRVREIPASDVAERAIDREAAAAPSDGARLAAALGDLHPDQRAILALHHLEGRSVVEIGAVLRVPAGTVKSRLFTARRALDRALRGDNAP
jgi:RNA polymerase sigma-70 factor (ECF subfamily)